MSIKLILDLQVKPEESEGLIKTFKDILVDTRNYEGCIEVELFQNQDNPDNLTLIQEWETRQNYETYFAWREEIGAIESLTATLTTPPNIRYFDHIET